eukprot:1513554-Prymnesium_polylepis.1
MRARCALAAGSRATRHKTAHRRRRPQQAPRAEGSAGASGRFDRWPGRHGRRRRSRCAVRCRRPATPRAAATPGSR